MWYLYGFALVAGLASAIAPGQNATLARSIDDRRVAGLVSLALSAVVLLLILVFAGLATDRVRLPSLERVAHVPWWAWGGGFLSALIAAAQLTAAQRIGAAVFLGLVVTAGVVTSILIDHFGLVGFPVHAAGLARVAGGSLMIAGVALVARF